MNRKEIYATIVSIRSTYSNTTVNHPVVQLCDELEKALMRNDDLTDLLCDVIAMYNKKAAK